MCGIVGSLNTTSHGYSVDNSRIMFSMLMTSILRGVDGTGIVQGPLDKEEPITYMKSTDCAPEFMSRNDMLDITRKARFVIGHTRAATLGGVTEAACHPFSVDDVIGVHNGTVLGIEVIFPDITGVNDSEIIYKALAAAEPDKATDVLKELESGAYAMVWYDARIRALRFARNDDRPLWFFKTDTAWWWASEPGTIAACIASVKKNPLGYIGIKPWQLAKHTLMTVPLDGGEATSEPYTPTVTYYGGGNAYGGYGGTGYQNDFWNRYYDDSWEDGKTYREATTAANKIQEGWITVTSADSLYTQGAWFERYRNQVRTNLVRLLKQAPNRSIVGFKEQLCNLAARTDTITGDPASPSICFIAQARNLKSGAVYGALDVADWGPMPIVGALSPEQLDIFARAEDDQLQENKLPIFACYIDNLKVYHDGTIGLGVVDVHFMGWVDEVSVSLTEDAVGSAQGHPQLQLGAWNDNVDWTNWAVRW
jgi:hypothetical protein